MRTYHQIVRRRIDLNDDNVITVDEPDIRLAQGEVVISKWSLAKIDNEGYIPDQNSITVIFKRKIRSAK